MLVGRWGSDRGPMEVVLPSSGDSMTTKRKVIGKKNSQRVDEKEARGATSWEENRGWVVKGCKGIGSLVNSCPWSLARVELPKLSSSCYSRRVVVRD